MNAEFQPINKTCRQCQAPFTISIDEQQLFRTLAARQPDGERGQGWKLPANCKDCRAVRRQQRVTVAVDAHSDDEWLTCADCGAGYVFGGRDREYFASRGWPKPRRCRECRRARAAMREPTTRW